MLNIDHPVVHKIAVTYNANLGHPNAQFDLSGLMVILELISEILSLFDDCRQTPDQIINSVHNPSLFQRLLLRRKVVNMYGGLRNFRRENGQAMLSAILSVGENLTRDEVLGMME